MVILQGVALPQRSEADLIAGVPTAFHADLATVSSSGRLTFTNVESRLFKVRGSFRLYGVKTVSLPDAQEKLANSRVRCEIVQASYTPNLWTRFKSGFNPVPVLCAFDDLSDVASAALSDVGFFLVSGGLAQPKCPEAKGRYSSCGATYERLVD